MRQLTRGYLQHARRHLPQGSDPIPGWPLGAFATLYLSDRLHSDTHFTVPGDPTNVTFPHALTSDTTVFTTGSTTITLLKAGVYVVQANISFAESIMDGVTPHPAIMAIGGTAANIYGANVSYPGNWAVRTVQSTGFPTGLKDSLLCPITPTDVLAGPTLLLTVQQDFGASDLHLDEANLTVAYIPCYSAT